MPGGGKKNHEIIQIKIKVKIKVSTSIICDELLKRFGTIPKRVDELRPLIKEPLLRKLSVVTYEELKYHQLQDFVRTDIKECKSEIAIQISEEKVDANDFDAASNELEEKFNPLVLLTARLDASNPLDRITILRTIVNIVRVIMTIH
ncbi:37207_t:CDS:2 [Gigaspora margarita]|uniref:37207_t:CDS:1 n=1 Tax=Gigaspora margarita TaxID=4874 RepID=A0ABN7UT88_GIGMA|nr:37207_t:CDS:2 [Gigaspora margarita]